MRIAIWLIGAILAALTVFMFLTAGWEHPPIDSQQSGYRGTGMAEIINPRTEAAMARSQSQQAPAALPQVAAQGPRAGDIYQNVQVLGDLPVARFTRLMQSITNWVAPDQGCGYCHNLQNLASDEVYTKDVARSMLQMTWSINGEWSDHVGETGVTCYTCHRGNNVPQYGWFNSDPDANPVGGMVGWRNGQNRAASSVGLTSLPEDPFSSYIEGDEAIRVVGNNALPNADSGATIQATEWSYGLMIHMSEALGVNCTYCHNSRAFSAWNESTPQRVTSWHGLEMARALNAEHVAPISGMLPPERLGPTGEGQKINCKTCHQGVNKPLYGAAMAADYPSLQARPGSGGTAARAPEPLPEVESADTADVEASIGMADTTDVETVAPGTYE